MNIQTLTEGFLRLITLVLLYYIVIHISHLIYSINTSDWSTLFMSVVALTFLIAAATVFWFYPVQFSQWLFKNIESSEIATTTNTDLVHAGVILLGLILGTLALIDLAEWLIYFGIMNVSPDAYQANRLKVGIFYILARIIIAVLLLAKSYWLTNFLLEYHSPANNYELDR